MSSPLPTRMGSTLRERASTFRASAKKESKNFPGGYGIQVSIGRGDPNWGHVGAWRNAAAITKITCRWTPTVKDAWRIPVARIDCSHSQDEVNMVAHMKRKLPEIAAAGGLQVDKNFDIGRGSILFRMLRSRVFTNYGALWPGGGHSRDRRRARMGDNPENSVLKLALSVLGCRQTCS